MVRRGGVAALRVIAGTLKGRRLQAPSWPELRPTSDKLRETLFNVIATHVPGARVLDGYAGTGAVGIEALSRGAAHVTFVDRDPRAARLVESNLAACGLSDRYAIIRSGFAETGLLLAGHAFDVIFLDPPYGVVELAVAIESATPLVSDGTMLVVEHARRDATPEATATLLRTRELRSGDSALAFYRSRGFTF